MPDVLARAATKARRSRVAFRMNQRRLRREARRGSGALRASAAGERLLALSYDDGPSPANTPDLLEILAAAGAHATFFVVGSRVEDHPELAVQIAAAGHELGNHTYSHQNLRSLELPAARGEVGRGAQAIELATGVATALFRPPFGKLPRGGDDLGVTTVLWSIDSGDTMPFSARRIAREVVGRAEPGDIVLMHDGGDRRQRTLDATKRVLDELGGRGYRFVTVSELLGASASSTGSSHTSRHHG
jgi:peptidoglycan-N-acetylglucosamine deacetylase